MSTSGVPRPSPLGKIAKKATPAAGGTPDESKADTTPTDKAPARGTRSGAGKATPARGATGARGAASRPTSTGSAGAGGSPATASTSPGRSPRSKADPATKSAAAAKGTPAGRGVPVGKSAPAGKASSAGKSAPAARVSARSAAIDTVEDDEELELDVDDADEIESNEIDTDDNVTPARTARPTSTRPAKSTGRPGAGKGTGGRGPVRAGGGGGRGRKPGRPVKVSKGKDRAPIGLFIVGAVVALTIIGFGVYMLVSRPDPTKWKDRADAIPGIIDYRNTHPDWIASRQHVTGVQTYPMDPPVGGNHNATWQNCMGDVYTAQIAKEHAVHSLEHGAVWVTYNPSLPKDQVDQLAAKVRGQTYLLMSPYPGLDVPISLQSYGFQLKVQSADDSRIDDFIANLRLNSTMEPGAPCSGGITDATGNTPLELNGTGMAPGQ